ncbi:replication factor A protein 1-like [Apium graveolens]|uniref:replication factor A protein 1-like n=1 Tax=Apium graveolens TaxID=4045 RepID=UPI003D7955AC
MDVFNSLHTVDNLPTPWRIRVRVTRMWPSFRDAGANFMGINLILLDDDDYHVHAFVNREVWQVWNHFIEEGSVYDISRFLTVDAAGKLRPVSSPNIFFFTNVTVCQQIVNPPINIPMHKFEFKTIESLYSAFFFDEQDEVPIFSTDVVGVVSNIQPVRNIAMRYREKILFRFDLEDTWHSVKVNLWDSIIGDVPQRLQSLGNEPAIIIIASCKYVLSRGNIVLSSIASTKIYINLAHDAVNDMRASFFNEDEVPPIG